MLGAQGVGKSSLCSQFLSSEHVNTYEKVGEWVGKNSHSQRNLIVLRYYIVWLHQERSLASLERALEPDV